MARQWYGGSLADYSVDSNGRPVAGAAFSVWTGPGGGQQLTDLLNEAGTPVTQATADARGFIRFQPPDGTTGALYLQDADDRWFVVNPMALADIAADAAAAAATSTTAVQTLTTSARLAAAATPEVIAVGTLIRNGTGAVVSASLVWPDGATGVFTATATAGGAVEAYNVTHVINGVTTTYTQPAVTRDGAGAITVRPAMVVT